MNFVKTQIREFKNVPYLTELINTSWFGSWAVINPKLPEAINKIPESNSNLCIAPGVCREWLKNFSPNERSEKSSSWNKCFNFWTHLNLEWASPHVAYQTQILNFNEFFKGQIKSEWISEIIKFPKYQPKRISALCTSGQKSFKFFSWYFGKLMISYFHSDFIWFLIGQNVNVFYCYCKNNLIYYRIPKSKYVDCNFLGSQISI